MTESHMPGVLAAPSGVDRAVVDAKRQLHRSVVATLVLAVTLAITAGLVLRMAVLTAGSPWLDELWTMDAVTRSFVEMVGARLVSDQSPPLWTMLAWAWLQIAGTYEPAVLRLLPLGFSVIGIAAAALGALRMPGLRPTLLVMAAILALSMLTIQFSVEFRAYSVMIGLGSVATVLWAGLLTGELPQTGRWIFAFAFTGALAGFGHYYGNLLYGAELAILIAAWLTRRGARFYLLAGWGVASVMPVVSWYVLTRQWFPNLQVAGPPSLAEVQTWLTWAFAPVTTLVAGQPPGYPDGSPGIGGLLLASVVLSLAGAAAVNTMSSRSKGTSGPLAVWIGAAALLVVVSGVVVAWGASLVLPPSMNKRNLVALVPALLLALAAASTSARAPISWITGALTVTVWLVAAVAFIAFHGTIAFAPQWQLDAGYRRAANALLENRSATGPTVIGLKTPWDWHGQWDAILRAETGAPPSMQHDPLPVQIMWVAGAAELDGVEVPAGPLLVLSDSFDQRATELFAWAEGVRGPCQNRTFGGPGYGVVHLLECP